MILGPSGGWYPPGGSFVVCRHYRAAFRHDGQPSTTHCSMTARSHRHSAPILYGRGILPASAIRQIWRAEQPKSTLTACTSTRRDCSDDSPGFRSRPPAVASAVACVCDCIRSSPEHRLSFSPGTVPDLERFYRRVFTGNFEGDFARDEVRRAVSRYLDLTGVNSRNFFLRAERKS